MSGLPKPVRHYSGIGEVIDTPVVTRVHDTGWEPTVRVEPPLDQVMRRMARQMTLAGWDAGWLPTAFHLEYAIVDDTPGGHHDD